MKILLSWIKEFIKIKNKKINLIKIINLLGLEIKKKKYINNKKNIEQYYKKYKNKNIKKIKILKILFNNKRKKFIFFLKNKKKIFSNKFYPKNTILLLKKKNKKHKYKVIYNSLIIDYILYINYTPNIYFLSYYINLIKHIINFLKFKFKKIKIKYNKFIFFKENIKKTKNKITIQKKEILLLKVFYLKHVKIINNNFNFFKKLNNSNLKYKNNILDYINILIKETGCPINILDYDKFKNYNIYKNSNDKIYFNNILIKNKYRKYLYIFKKRYINFAGLKNNKLFYIDKKTKNILIYIILYKRDKILKIIKKFKFNNTFTKIYKNKININNIIYIQNKLNFFFKKKIKILINFNKLKNKNKFIKINFKYIKTILGFKIKKSKIINIIKNLDCKIININKSNIILKFNRDNLFIKDKVDIINEIIKFININKINIKIKKKSEIYNKNKFIKITKYEKIINIIINILTNYGFFEVINIPFIKIKNDCKFTKNIIKKKIKIKKNYYLSNRLFYNILNNILYNINRKEYNLKLFEIANLYSIKKNKIKEEKYIEILITKKKIKNNIKYLYKIYNILLIILNKLGIYKNLTNIIKTKDKKFYNIKILILFNNIKIISLKIISKKFLKEHYKIYQPIFYVIIYLNKIIKIVNIKKHIKYKKYSKYENIEKDLSFIVKKDFFYNDFYQIIKNFFKKELIKLILYNIYTKNISSQKKKYTFKLILKNKFGLNKKYYNNKLKKIILILKKKLFINI